jgi:hypothetical protein
MNPFFRDLYKTTADIPDDIEFVLITSGVLFHEREIYIFKPKTPTVEGITEMETHLERWIDSIPKTRLYLNLEVYGNGTLLPQTEGYRKRHIDRLGRKYGYANYTPIHF